MAKGKRAGSKRQEARAGRRRQRWPWLIGIGVAVVVIASGAYGLWPKSWEKPGQFVASQGNVHLATADSPHPPYSSDPPTSGPHLQWIAPWGIHAVPIQRELQVHNLEDGGVVVQYNCDCPELQAKLRAIVERYKDRVVLAPYPTMKSRIALTAWTRIDAFEEFDEQRIVRFIEAYRGIDHHAR
jgi:hypothetical protein